MSSEVDVAEELVSALEEAIQLLGRSEESDWTPFAPEELVAEIEQAIQELRQGGELQDAPGLLGRFAAGGPVQEISLACGWSDQFIVLAESVERLILTLPFRITWSRHQVSLVLPAITAFVILALATFDSAARLGILSGSGFASAVAVLLIGYAGTRISIGRHTLSVSIDGLWVDASCVPWKDVEGVSYSRIKLPSVRFRRVGRWWPTIGVPRRSVPEISAYVDRLVGSNQPAASGHRGKK